MVLELKDLFLTDGARLHDSYKLNMNNVKFDSLYPFVSPVDIEIDAENRAGLVKVTLNVKLDFAHPCDRCGTDTTRVLNYTFKHNLVVSLSGDDNEDYIETPDFKLNLDELVKADILLELPGKWLCSEECKGLCEKCGANLNLGDCSCDKRQIDPRLEVLKQLIDSE